jgi:membrane-bound ClpP family serine protease
MIVAANVVMTSLPLLLAASPEDAGSTSTLLATMLLIPVTVALLIGEFIIASGGMLAVAAVLTGVTSIVLAFLISNGTGLLVLVLIPTVSALTTRWGLARLARSGAVPKAEIREDAGYHHLAGDLGIGIGAVGELVTDAMPSGRARFTTVRGTNEIDVRVIGAVASRGQQVVVIDLHGASVTVQAAPSGAAHA